MRLPRRTHAALRRREENLIFTTLTPKIPVSAKIATPSREALLELAFSDIPSQIGSLALRPLSAGSFTLLGRLGNPMMVGKQAPVEAVQEDSQTAMFAAVIQYVWVHSADIEEVIAVETPSDIPAAALKHLGFQLSIGQALAFLERYQASALRMTASLAETEQEEDETPGKPPELAPVGSPASSTPAEPAETPCASATSSGSCQLSEPSPTSTPPTVPTEPAADGPSLTLMPDFALPAQTPPS